MIYLHQDTLCTSVPHLSACLRSLKFSIQSSGSKWEFLKLHTLSDYPWGLEPKASGEDASPEDVWFQPCACGPSCPAATCSLKLLSHQHRLKEKLGNHIRVPGSKMSLKTPFDMAQVFSKESYIQEI